MGKLKIDEEYLLGLAREKRAESRQKLSAAMTELFGMEAETLSEHERHLMFDILRKLIHDMEMPIRQLLSEHLSERTNAPHDLVVLLANDAIEIARPILEKSHVLEEEDLIEIVYHRTQEHRLSIALRERVSEQVSSAIVEQGEEPVVARLIENRGAALAPQTLDYLVERSRRVEVYRDPLLHRSELPMQMAAKMFHWVSAALRQFIVENWEVDEDVLDQALEAGTRDELEYLDRSGQAPEELAGPKLANEFENPILLLIALHAGELPLFVETFRGLTGLEERLTSRILFEEGGEGLAVACRALGISSHDFEEIYDLTRTPSDMPQSMRLHLKTEAVDLFKNVDRVVAVNVLHRWQRGKDYQSAMRDLELGLNNSLSRRLKYEEQLAPAEAVDIGA